MKSHQRLLIFLLLALALTCVISPWMALGAEWAASQWPDQLERYPFSRIFNRAFMFSGIILFFLCRRFLRFGKLSELGLPKHPSAGTDVITGWSLAVGSMVALGFAMTIAGVFTPYLRLSLSESASRCAEALFGGLFVAFFEEIFFRGILFKGLLEDGKPVRAFIAGNLFYSAIHFVKPGEPYFIEGFEPLAGFRHLLATFAPFLEPVSLAPGLLGLFLIGVVLSYTYTRTGTLYLGIGLHAGWIFGVKTIRVFGNYKTQDLGWVFGSTDPKIVSGVAGWIGLLLVASVVHILTRERIRRAAEPLRQTETSRPRRYVRQ